MNVVRLTVNLPKELLLKLQLLALQDKATMTNTIQAAIESGLRIHNELEAGTTILLDRGNLRKLERVAI